MINLKTGQLYFLDFDCLRVDPYQSYLQSNGNIYQFDTTRLQSGWIRWRFYYDELTYKVIKKVKISG